MSTCPSACTGTCPEIVPVTITQTIVPFPTDTVEYVFTEVGNGIKTMFTLLHAPILVLGVSIGGVSQPPDAYTLSTNPAITITFDDAPADGELVLVRCLAVD